MRQSWNGALSPVPIMRFSGALGASFGGVAMHVTRGRIRLSVWWFWRTTRSWLLSAQVERVDAGRIQVVAIAADPLWISRSFRRFRLRR